MLKDKLMRQIRALNLDLKDKVVLTEAASGPYMVTAILAALAGAEVYAFCRSTRYGTTAEVFNTMQQLCNDMGEQLNIHYIEQLTPDIISKADIVTNSGHLRPLDKEKLQSMQDGAALPMMYEAWEWREGELDLEYCKSKGIKVAATNERHPEVDVFNYLGDMALKQIFDAGLTPYRNDFVLICNNDFGPFIAKTLVKVCAGLGVIDKAENRSKYPEGISWLSDFPDIRSNERFRNCEAVIFTAYPFIDEWIGTDNELKIADIKKAFADPYILRYAGDINEAQLRDAGISFYPEHVKKGHMGVLPSEVGFDPIIRLQSGGLKVGELILKGETHFNGVELAVML